MQVVGISLVRNEDRFLGQALRNVAMFCDRLFVADHMSTDHTPELLRDLARDLDHLEVRRVRHSAESHALVEGFAGTETWVLSVDGDELYDRDGLALLRRELEGGAHSDVFRVRPAGLHCDELDESAHLASGYLSPPSRPLVGLLNFAALESWTGVRDERLHGGNPVFREGYVWDSWHHLGEDGWEVTPFRDLHVCFLRRSSRDPEAVPDTGRPNLAETRAFRRGLLRPLNVLARARATADTSDWKGEKYRRGERVTVDASAFLRPAQVAQPSA
jgi:glycosyltransferase involved in cell wall biosynthesis